MGSISICTTITGWCCCCCCVLWCCCGGAVDSINICTTITGFCCCCGVALVLLWALLIYVLLLQVVVVVLLLWWGCGLHCQGDFNTRLSHSSVPWINRIHENRRPFTYTRMYIDIIFNHHDICAQKSTKEF